MHAVLKQKNTTQKVVHVIPKNNTTNRPANFTQTKFFVWKTNTYPKTTKNNIAASTTQAPIGFEIFSVITTKLPLTPNQSYTTFYNRNHNRITITKRPSSTRRTTTYSPAKFNTKLSSKSATRKVTSKRPKTSTKSARTIKNRPKNGRKTKKDKRKKNN